MDGSHTGYISLRLEVTPARHRAVPPLRLEGVRAERDGLGGMALLCPPLKVEGGRVELQQGDVVHLGHVVIVLHDDLGHGEGGALLVSDIVGAAHYLESPGTLALDTVRGRHYPVLGNDHDLPLLRQQCANALLAVGQIGLSRKRQELAAELEHLRNSGQPCFM